MLFCIFFILVNVPIVYAATYYMPDHFVSLRAAFSGMSSGDTLIIRDGTYTGTTNAITDTYKPPSGTIGNYTKIQAENDGEVTFEGDAICLISDVSYISFQGLIWRRTRVNVDAVAIGAHHIKFSKCGVYSNSSISTARREDGFMVISGHDVLFEDCYGYGNFRYVFYAGGSSEKIIFRRCVVRIDAYNTQTGIAAFMIYDSKNIELQNCIVIDIDNPSSFYQLNNNYTVPNAIYTRNTASGYDLTNVNIQGCVALNISSGQFVLGGGGEDFDFTNSVFWDGYNGIRSRYGGGSWDHCLSGKISSSSSHSDCYYTEQNNEPITNSIAYGAISSGIKSAGSYFQADYNCLYNNGNDYEIATPGLHSICAYNFNAIDPLDSDPGNGIKALKYLVRIEDGSDLDGRASDGEDIGATILKQIGVSGTMWGETGYNVVTNEDLWPFPNEELIRKHMRAYSYTGINADRGFCAEGQTLTKYIWEYLGNTIPRHIYGEPIKSLHFIPILLL